MKTKHLPISGFAIGARRLLLIAAMALPVAAGAQTSGSAPAPAPALDAAAFQVKLWAASCMTCHGPNGRAESTGLTIGGRPAKDLLDKLLGYKNGTLPATIMHQHARGYSDQELAQIAAYFASLK